MEPNNNQAAWKGIYDTLGNISKSLGELNTGGQTKSSGSGGTKNTNQGLLDALTERLTSQGKGIVSSSTSGLQDALSGAMKDTQRSGDLTSQALQSEREREVSFAQDRAAAQYTNALESRSGFATMTYGLRELTETTEKSIRDLDKRYQEAILTNDAATAQRVSDLRVKQLEMQQDAEARYMDNLFKTASMQQNEYQFNASYDQAERQFMERYNLDISQFDKGQALDRERMNMDDRQFNARMAQDRELAYAEIAAANARAGKGTFETKDREVLNANIYAKLQSLLNNGDDVRKQDPVSLAQKIAPALYEAGWDLEAVGGANISAAVASALTQIKQDYSKADPTFDYGYRYQPERGATVPKSQQSRSEAAKKIVPGAYTSLYR